MGRLRDAVPILAMACLLVSAIVWQANAPEMVARAEGPLAAPAQAQAGAVPAATCLQCHDGAGYETLPAFHRDCSSCHTGAKVHVDAPDATNIGKPASADCLTCQTNSPKLMKWEFGPHARTEVTCSDCHAVHAPPAREFRRIGTRTMDAVSTQCLTCHQEVQAKLSLPSHHPVREGGLSCVSCHDPHGGESLGRISKTEKCLSCHQTHRGPRAFEHAPVVEDCATCHVPHGSANRSLLELPQPVLCLQCHSLADNRHGLGAAAGARVSGAAFRSCTSCHSAVHGSNVDRVLRY